MIKVLVFDLDDTLYDEIDYCRSGFSAVAEHLARSYQAVSADAAFTVLWDEFTAGNHTTTFNAALERLGIAFDRDLISSLVTVYREHRPDITLPDESRRILESLSTQYSLALLTDGFLPAQQLKVRALDIEHYFDCIVYTEQLGRAFWKPSPVGYEKIARALDAAPENMAYIADNEEKDFIAPNRLGFLTVQLTRPDRLHTSTSDDPDARAAHHIRALSELPALLDRFQ